MDVAAITDMILRAVAAMREREELPEMDAPRIVVVRESGPAGDTYRCDIGEALVSAQSAPAADMSADALAGRVVKYLQEVVDLVPAYHDIAAVTLLPNGGLLVTLRRA